MKSDLKRIEATLQNLGISTASYSEPPATQNRSYSFEIDTAAQKSNPFEQKPSDGTLIPSTVSIQKFPAQQSTCKEPTLPKFSSTISRINSGSNLALEMNSLPETYPDSVTCKAGIQKIVRQIKDLYMEGPIVDGWLESQKYTPEPRNVTRRGESVEPQMDYVTEVCNFEQGKVTCESPRAGYRLCGLDAAGKKWSYPCPLEQLPSVSIAIARYQKLQQLLQRKHYFETCLRQNHE